MRIVIYIVVVFYANVLFAGDIGYTMASIKKNINNALSYFDKAEQSNPVIGQTYTVKANDNVISLLNEYNEPNSNAFKLAGKDTQVKEGLLDYLAKLINIAPYTTGTPEGMEYANKLDRLSVSTGQSGDPAFNSLSPKLAELSQNIRNNNPEGAQIIGKNISNDINKYTNNLPKQNYGGSNSGFMVDNTLKKEEKSAFLGILESGANIFLSSAISSLASSLTGSFLGLIGIKNVSGVGSVTNSINTIGGAVNTASQQGLSGNSTGANQSLTNGLLGTEQNLVNGAVNNGNNTVNNIINPKDTNTNQNYFNQNGVNKDTPK